VYLLRSGTRRQNLRAESPTWAAEPAKPDPAANDVCSYVAVANNRGQQDKLWGHRFLIRANGQNLIEIDGGAAVQRTAPPRMLLRLRGNRIETACRVKQRVTYTPQPEPINKAP
jgi:hypothetical protein